MGLLLWLVTLPVSGPVGGALWVAEQARAAAEKEHYDEAAIGEQLAELERRFEAGEISARDHEEAGDRLVERLLEARMFWATRDGGPTDEGHPDA